MTYAGVPGPPSGLFGQEACHRFRLGDRHFLLHVRRSGVEVILDAGAHQVLSLCEGFQTLDDHAEGISRRLSGGDSMRAQVRDLLSRFVAQGLLCPARQLLSELRHPGPVPQTRTRPVRTLAIRTCDRPRALAQLLDGVWGREDRAPLFARVIVVDDSRSDDARKHNQAFARSRAQSGDVEVRYHGPDEQALLVGELKRAFPNRADTIDWLLSRWGGGVHGLTPGRSLNHALLLTAGERVLLLDDDARIDPRLAPEPESGVQVGAVPQSVRFFSSREEVSRLPEAMHLNPAVAHGEFLGGTLGDALSRLAKAEPLQENSIAALDPVEAGQVSATSPVLVSVNGVFGDPGAGSARWVYELDDDRMWGQLAESAEAYRAFTTRRRMWRGHRTTTFLMDFALMLTAGVGLDNSRPLAPTMPDGRNEDLLLGDTIKALYPDSVAVALPWGMSHFPEPERTWNPADLDQPARPGLPGLLAAFVRASGANCPAQQLERRTAYLAEALLALADASEPELKDRVLHEVLGERSARIARIQANMARRHNRLPGYWVQDAQRIIAANTRSTLAGGVPWQTEIGIGDGDARAADARLRDALANYANALKLWPALWQWAQSTRNSSDSDG